MAMLNGLFMTKKGATKMADSIVLRNLNNDDIYFKNFEGAEIDYNKAGDRNFGIFLSDEVAEDLEAKGWNIKRVNKEFTRNGNPNPNFGRAFIKVLVRLNWRPIPKIYKLTRKNMMLLNEESIVDLDDVFFDNIDLKITRVYLKRYDQWTQYLEKGFFTISEDELDLAYANRFAPIDDEEELPFI